MTARAWIPGLVALLAGCSGLQRAPGPLWVDAGADPGAGADAAATPDPREAPSPVGSVIRHSAPVWLRLPGAPAGTRISSYEKRQLVPPGGRVRVGRAGRAELLWPDSATSVVLFDTGEAVFGDVGRDEPLVSLASVSRARLLIGSADRIRLPGGALLSGIPAAALAEGRPAVGGFATYGPFLLERRDGGLLRIKNHSKQVCRVRFRGEDLELLGGESLDLPMTLTAGGEGPDPSLERVLQGEYAYRSSGGLRGQLEGGELRIRAEQPARVVLHGLTLRLAAGEEARLSGLSAPESGPAGER